MGTIHIPPGAILFAGLLFNDRVKPASLFSRLEGELGKIVLKSTPFPFTETDYYREEMGSSITRQYVAFDTLIDMNRIVQIKQKTNEMERALFSDPGGAPGNTASPPSSDPPMNTDPPVSRNVNIDPGYLTSAKVVLATTKDYGHRIYLGEGIYAEVTLHYRRGGFVPWEWTYRDYTRVESIRFFNRARELYRSSVRSSR